MNNNFDAVKLSELKGYIEWFFKSIAEIPGKSQWFRYTADFVRSEDSNLADTCTNLSDTILKLQSKITEYSAKAQASLEQFVQATVVNESDSSSKLSEISDGISSISSDLDNINFN